jgi:hypothetical protein
VLVAGSSGLRSAGASTPANSRRERKGFGCVSRAPWTGRASRLPWRGLGRTAWSLLSDLAIGELADDVEGGRPSGALLDEVEQDPLKCRRYASEGEATFEPRSGRQHSSPHPHLAEARETSTGKDILAPL